MENDCIQFTCACGMAMNVPATMAGKSGRCQQCGARLIVPGTPSPETIAAAKPAFGLHWIIYLCTAVAAVISASRTGLTTPYGMGAFVGSYIALLVLSAIPALIAFYLAGRSRQVATAVFLVFLGLITLSQLSSGRAQRQQALNTVTSEVEQVKCDLGSAVQSGQADPAKASEALARVSATLNRAADSAGSDDAACMRAAGAVLERFKEELDDYTAAANGMTSRSPFEPAWLTSQTDLTDYRDRISRFRQQNQHLREFFDNIETMAATELRKQDVSERNSRAFIKGFVAKYAVAKPLFHQIRDRDDEIADILSSAADLLARNWGQWRYRGETKNVIFESGDAARDYNALRRQLQAKAQDQTEAQRRYVALVGT